MDHALVAHPADEGEGLAVRRRGGPDRSARAGDEALDVAGLLIEPLNDEDLGIRVLVVFEDAAGRDVLAEVDVAAVGGEDRLAGVLLVGTISLLMPEDFPDATVWSVYGRGYLFVPLVLPVLGLLFLRRRAAE